MWNNTLILLPSDGEKVWIRKDWFSFYPAIATFNATTNIFTLDGSGLELAAVDVARWKLWSAPEGIPIGEAMLGLSLIVE
jgi:hypothetical protein